MKQEQKEKLLNDAKKHVVNADKKIKQKIMELHKNVEEGKERGRRISSIDRLVHERLMDHKEKRVEELTALHGSPYFMRCDIVFDALKERQTFYFAKFHFDEESIYSWVTSIASVRFEDPGKISYTGPDGKIRSGILLRKDQYMIVGGKIMFFTNEEIDRARELIYQEHFSVRKRGFVLPEIIEQMEKAQDQVIRAHHIGPFVISGPAGSGKTTLALHRVGYLMQSPETTKFYPSSKVIVFVQDASTKKYFSHLLPELGIENVVITTFYEWACEVIGLNEYSYATRIGGTEEEKDVYEFKKMQALKNSKILAYANNIYSLLNNVYSDYFDKKEDDIFTQQKKEKNLDRFDLTIILKAYIKNYGSLNIEYEDFIELANGEFRKKLKKAPLRYSLIVADEFQNYLSEQIEILNTCLYEKFKSIIYVGDIAQQTQFGTIRNFDKLHEIIPDERKVVLHKVYRNTKNILNYIKKLGYKVNIPEEIREGEPVEEIILNSKQAEMDHIKKIIHDNPSASIGILAKDAEYLYDFKKEKFNTENAYIFSMQESQGVEFDIVFIVGVRDNMFKLNYDKNISEKLMQEKKRIQKDILYVALTRAINKLYVLGSVKLSGIKFE